MGNTGLIHRDAPDHPKFQKASLTAIGLWALGTAKTRQLRSSGHLTHEQAMELARGDGSLIEELVSVELWDERDGTYSYHDYVEHNNDYAPETTAARLVYDILGERYPRAVQSGLTRKVAELIAEGQETAPIRSALKLWSDRPDAGIGLLPFLVAEAIKQKQDGDLVHVIRECWKSGDATALRRHGHWFTPPDPPLTVKTAEQMRTFMLKATRAWLEKLRKDIQ